MTPSTNLLGGRSPGEFLRDYWQKQPLLIREAMPGFSSPLTPEELAGLACEPDIHSRLVQDLDGNEPWEVRYGPFTASDLAQMPETHWSLLVSDVEKILPELQTILEPFRFIPDWRIDDLMISYAAPQGSVGPHVDQYDVFLLQGLGSRQWQIGTRQVEESEFLPDSELRILREFEPDQTWTLNPGDMLYLPPGIPHHGVALETCMTYSIGFRAPAHTELITAWLEEILQSIPPDARYQDPDLAMQTCPGEIADSVLRKVRSILHHYLSQADDAGNGWFGRFITEPKHEIPGIDDHQLPDAEQLKRWIRGGGALVRQPSARLAYIQDIETVRVFANGVEYQVAGNLLPNIELLTRTYRLECGVLEAYVQQAPLIDLLIGLFRQGVLSFDEQ